LCLGTNADLMVFSDYAGYVTYAPNTPVLTFAKQIPFNSGGTNFPSVFAKASRKYERVIILSDMQGYQSHNYGYGQKGFREAAQEYKRRFNCDPRIFSFDLAGYGQLMLPEKNVFCLAGFSDKTIQLIAQLDKDPKALVNAVEAVTF
jgi:60 kDa SS-A/Ro ribonucleoprotein